MEGEPGPTQPFPVRGRAPNRARVEPPGPAALPSHSAPALSSQLLNTSRCLGFQCLREGLRPAGQGQGPACSPFHRHPGLCVWQAGSDCFGCPDVVGRALRAVFAYVLACRPVSWRGLLRPQRGHSSPLAWLHTHRAKGGPVRFSERGRERGWVATGGKAKERQRQRYPHRRKGHRGRAEGSEGEGGTHIEGRDTEGANGGWGGAWAWGRSLAV